MYIIQAQLNRTDNFMASLLSSSTTRLYRGRAPRQSVWQFYVLPHLRQSWETMTSVSVGHIILTPSQPVVQNGSDTFQIKLKNEKRLTQNCIEILLQCTLIHISTADVQAKAWSTYRALFSYKWVLANNPKTVPSDTCLFVCLFLFLNALINN